MTSETLQNGCFDEIAIGDGASVTSTLSLRDVQLFAAVSGDRSPTELDRQLGPAELGARSMWLGAHGLDLSDAQRWTCRRITSR